MTKALNADLILRNVCLGIVTVPVVQVDELPCFRKSSTKTIRFFNDCSQLDLWIPWPTKFINQDIKRTIAPYMLSAVELWACALVLLRVFQYLFNMLLRPAVRPVGCCRPRSSKSCSDCSRSSKWRIVGFTVQELLLYSSIKILWKHSKYRILRKIRKYVKNSLSG